MGQVREHHKEPSSFVRQSSIADIAASQQRHWAGLLYKIAAGDRAALGAFYDETSPLVFGLLLRITADRASAEEALLDVFQQVWREAGGFAAQRDDRLTSLPQQPSITPITPITPITWLLALARACALGYQRGETVKKTAKKKSAPQRGQAPAAGMPAMPDVDALAAQQQRARAALARLSVSQREVVELAYYEGLRPPEIAARLGLPLDSIHHHLKFAMMALREYLKPVAQEQP